MENKTVDVIIPAYHPGKEFATLIKRLEKQSVPIHRIIVMIQRNPCGIKNGKNYLM